MKVSQTFNHVVEENCSRSLTPTDDSNLLEGTYPVELSQETQEDFEVVADEDIYLLEPIKDVSLAKIKHDLGVKGEKSDFFSLREQIEACRLEEPVIIYEPTRIHGSSFLLCLNADSKFGYKQAEEDADMALIDRDKSFEYKPPEPKEWYSIGSEKEIEGTWVKNTRPKVTMGLLCFKIHKYSSPRYKTEVQTG